MTRNRWMKRLALAALIAGALQIPAIAAAQQGGVGIAHAAEESLPDATAQQLRSAMADEQQRLLVKLQANHPDQTPGGMTTSTAELAGARVAQAMQHMLVVQPHGQPVVIGIVGQVNPDGSRQLVLFNLTAWINHGRVLDVNGTEVFALLDDAKIRQPGGDRFQVDGVNYSARAEGPSIVFHRD